MELLQAYKFELTPTGEQTRKMRQFAGACRFVYNKALALQSGNYRNGGKFIGKFAMKKRFTEWRNSPETPWLADAPRHPVDESILDLDRAFQNFFARRAEYPQFKRKGQSADGLRYPNKNQIKLDRENGRISLPKLGYVR
jgi:putative transposase